MPPQNASRRRAKHPHFLSKNLRCALLRTSLWLTPCLPFYSFPNIHAADALPAPPFLSPAETASQHTPPALSLAVRLTPYLPWGIALTLAGILLSRKNTPLRPAPSTEPLPQPSGVPHAIAEALREAKETAESANRAKDEFLAALSHELRSPLNPVLLLASEYARSSGLPQRLREDFQIILHNVRLQARLIDDLLDLNRIQRGGLSISARRLNLRNVLEEVCKGLHSEAQEREVSLILDCPREECLIRGDNMRLHQIFGNIVRNAIKFAPRQTPVQVRLQVTPCAAHVRISDSGPGIRAEDLQRIFTPFVQAPHAGPAAGSCGLGLGLAIAQRLVERHRGSIWAESDGPGKGACFHIELPLEPLDPLATPPSDSENTPREPHSAPQTLRVLLLEDHESTRTILARMLQKHGFEIFTAGSIDAASRILSAQKVDVLISDLGLPDGEGFPLPGLWRDQIRIGSIALSGFGMESDITRSRACGFLRHLTKPVEFQTLLEAVESLGGLPRDPSPSRE